MFAFIKKLNPFQYQWMLLLILACCPLYHAYLGAYGVYQILSIPFIFIFFFDVINKKKQRLIKGYSRIFIAMIVQVALFSAIMPERNLLQDIKVFLISLIIMLYPTNIKTAKLIYPILSFVGLLVGYYMLKNQDMVNDFRLSLMVGDVLQDPNWITLFLIPTFCFGLDVQKYKSFLYSLIGLFLIFFSIYVVFLSGSRGTMFSLVVVLGVWLFINVFRGKVKSYLLVLLATFLLLYFESDRLIASVDVDLLSRFDSDATDAGRFDIWHRLLPEYLNGNFFQLVFGRGIGSCLRDLGMSGHNIILEQLFQMGILGLVLLISFLFIVFKDAIKSKNILGFYILLAFFTASLLTPVWGNIYFMLPLSAVVYVNNEYLKYVK